MTSAPEGAHAARALLLQAALQEGQRAAAAWTRWASTSTLDALDADTARLLPLIARRLPAASLGRETTRLRGIHRFHWTRNQLGLARLRETLDRLGRDGIHPVVAGGPVLAARGYPDLGSRPTDAVDLLVRPAEVGRARMQLRELGWRPTPASGPVVPFGWRPLTFLGNAGWRLALHPTRDWSTFSREPVRVDGLDLTSLDATATLLAVCAGPRRFHESSSVAWVADAALLVQAQGARLDWARIAARLAAGGAPLALRQRLAYLRESELAPVPSSEALAGVPQPRPSTLARRAVAAVAGLFPARARLGSSQW